MFATTIMQQAKRIPTLDEGLLPVRGEQYNDGLRLDRSDLFAMSMAFDPNPD